MQQIPCKAWVLAAALTACVRAPTPRPPSSADPVQLVESAPVETVLNHPDVPDARDVWPERIDRARATLDFAEFYASNAPGSALERVVKAVEEAAARGVRVRFLAEEKFYKTYPETLERLARQPNIQVRRFDMGALTGGVLHAKYFLVDGEEAYLGSQNFDWRALEHIQELGTLVRVPEVVRALQDVFETDWALSAMPREALAQHPAARVRTSGLRFPVRLSLGGAPAEVTFVASPQGLLPDESLWDLPRLVALLDSARKTIRVQVLTYKPASRDGEPFYTLDAALRRAAARGVEVRLLVSDWNTRKDGLAGLLSLASVPHVHVNVETIPPWSGGDVPFARVVHAKYLAVDGARAWVGTSNWERDYFFQSRNVGLVVDSVPFAERLERFFDDGWNGPYVKPAAAFAAPAASAVR